MSIALTRLRHAVTLFEELAGDPQALDVVLGRSGLKRADIQADSKFQVSVCDARFIREAASYLRDPCFGAKAGLRFKDASTLTAYISKHSRNLRAAIQNSSRFHAVVDPKISFSLIISNTEARFDLEFQDSQMSRYHRYAEFILFGALARMRRLTGVEFYPQKMQFCHQVKSPMHELERLAGCTVEFGAESMGIVLSVSTLDLPVPTYDAELRNHLMEYGERLLRERPNQKPTLRNKIEGLVMNSLPGRIVSADEVASNLGMSRRTFARRLTDEGFSYREIVDDIRGDLAKTYLTGGFSIAEIAFLLDYADQAAFSTAFKRWTGHNPTRFREIAVSDTRH